MSGEKQFKSCVILLQQPGLPALWGCVWGGVCVCACFRVREGENRGRKEGKGYSYFSPPPASLSSSRAHLKRVMSALSPPAPGFFRHTHNVCNLQHSSRSLPTANQLLRAAGVCHPHLPPPLCRTTVAAAEKNGFYFFSFQSFLPFLLQLISRRAGMRAGEMEGSLCCAVFELQLL